jgi:hypothetical protein
VGSSPSSAQFTSSSTPGNIQAHITASITGSGVMGGARDRDAKPEKGPLSGAEHEASLGGKERGSAKDKLQETPKELPKDGSPRE